MSKTNYQIQGRDFLINGKKTYSEIPQNDPACHGLLFNARFIQGLFQDINKANAEHYNRFGKVFDPEINTDELIAALPQWYNIGLRAFTIGLMGGGPCMSYKDWGTLEFGSFSPDGKSFDPAVRTRLEKVLKAADELGMLVIVSFLYHGQFRYFDNDEAIENACHMAVKMLCELDYDNVIIEVANEYDVIEKVVPTSVIGTPEKMAELVKKCQQWCGGRFAVGASTCFVEERQEIVMKASDMSYYFFGLVCVAVFIFIKHRVVHSKMGRAFSAIRDNVKAADGMGINVRLYKMLAFAICAFFTGFAGSMYAHLVGFLSPDTFTQKQSVLFLTMLIFGGTTSFGGPLIGVVSLMLITESIRAFTGYQTLVYGVIIILVVVLLPKGVFGEMLQLKEKLRTKKKQSADREAV